MRHNDRTTAWAVYLGANTAPRLAAEWGIPRTHAVHVLQHAVAVGMIRRAGRGIFYSLTKARLP